MGSEIYVAYKGKYVFRRLLMVMFKKDGRVRRGLGEMGSLRRPV